MELFSKEIQDFQRYGTYDYKFDEGGNLVFKKTSPDFNQHYVSIPLANCVYDNTKIESFYSVDFQEIIPTTTETIVDTPIPSQIKDLQFENQNLQRRLADLTKIADNNSTQSDILATKQIILELRIKLKQGSAERDFSNVFPYLPLTKNK